MVFVNAALPVNVQAAKKKASVSVTKKTYTVEVGKSKSIQVKTKNVKKIVFVKVTSSSKSGVKISRVKKSRKKAVITVKAVKAKRARIIIKVKYIAVGKKKISTKKLKVTVKGIAKKAAPVRTAETTKKPVVSPTTEPVTEPTVMPTTTPTVKPTTKPTAEPTDSPSPVPTVSPTSRPAPSESAGNISYTGEVITFSDLEPLEYQCGEDGVWRDSEKSGKNQSIPMTESLDEGKALRIRLKTDDNNEAGEVLEVFCERPQAPKAVTVNYSTQMTSESISDILEYTFHEDGFTADAEVYLGVNETVSLKGKKQISVRVKATDGSFASAVSKVVPNKKSLPSFDVAAVDTSEGVRYELRKGEVGVEYEFYFTDTEVNDLTAIPEEGLTSITCIEPETSATNSVTNVGYNYVYARIAATSEAFESDWVLTGRIKVDNDFDFGEIP